MALGPNTGDYPTRPHTLDPMIPTKEMGLHIRLKYQGAPNIECSGGTHPNTHHRIHRCHRMRRNPHHHAYGTSGNPHCPSQIRGPLMDWNLHRLPLQPTSNTPPLLQTGPCHSPPTTTTTYSSSIASQTSLRPAEKKDTPRPCEKSGHTHTSGATTLRTPQLNWR